MMESVNKSVRIVLTIFLKGSHSVTKGPMSHLVPTTVGVRLAQWNYFIHTVLKFNFWGVGGGLAKDRPRML